MTDVELEVAESFERVFPVPVVSADWDDVLDRAGAGDRHRTWPIRSWRVIAVALVILVGGLLVTPALGIGDRLLDLIEGAPAPPDLRISAWSPDGRRIAFLSNRDGKYRVYVMNADGSGQRRLMRIKQGATFAWSPDGRKFAFEGSPEGISVVNADGKGQRRLARRGFLPAWSPDGRKIAFVSSSRVYVMNADGGEHRSLTRPISGRYSALTWSPDGGKLVFLRGAERGFGLYVVNADGSELRDLSPAGLASEPAWSPDGRKMAFVRAEAGVRHGVHVVNADGSGLRDLTRKWEPAQDYAPVWSPDGHKIAFVSDRDGNWEVYVMNADGTGQRNLTRNPADDGGRVWSPNGWSPDGTKLHSGPVWSPDGRKLAFVSERDGDAEVYVMNADGSGQRRLSQRGA